MDHKGNYQVFKIFQRFQTAVLYKLSLVQKLFLSKRYCLKVVFQKAKT